MPETVVEAHRKLPLLGQPLQRLALPDRVIAGDIGADLGARDEEAAIDPAAIAHRLLGEARHPRAVMADGAEAAGRLHRRHGAEPALVAMEIDQATHVDIGDAVAIGEAERLVTGDMRQDAPDAAADLGGLAGFDEGDAPGLGLRADQRRRHCGRDRQQCQNCEQNN